MLCRASRHLDVGPTSLDGSTADREVEEELGIFDLTRRQIGCILTASRSEAWERTGVVGDRGDRTAGQMIHGAVEHLAHHVGFVIDKRRALGID